MKSIQPSQSAGRRLTHALTAFIMAMVGGMAAAAPLDLARVPLIINASVPPNVMVTLDDSGSMGFGHMPDMSPGTSCNYYDASINRLYYNPDVSYTPPLNKNGVPFPPASTTEPYYDGFRTTMGSATNFRTSYRVSVSHQSNYNDNWRTNSFPTGVAQCANILCLTTYQHAFYCRNNTVHLIKDTNPSQWQNFANWFQYYRTRGLAARSALSTSFARMDPSIRVAWQNLHQSQAVPGTTQIKALSDPAWRTSFFDNWLHRSPFSGVTPTRRALVRAGQFFSQGGTGAANPYWDERYGEELSCRQNFHVMVTDGYTNEDSAGTRPLASPAIGDFDNAARPTLPDGKAISGPNAQIYYNATAGGSLNPRLPNLADIAMYYWARDLRTLPNNVPKYYGDRRDNLIAGGGGEDEIYFNPANDPGDWQRMVNFFVTFGVGGNLTFDSSPSCVNNPALNNSTICQSTRLLRLRRGDNVWPAVDNNSATSIDDTWHAAINSRGQYISAQDPQELVDSLSAVLDNVSQRLGTTGTAGSSAFQRSDSLMFEASYDSGTWTGDVNAYLINPDGSQGPAAWDDGSAAEQVDRASPGARRIYINTNSAGTNTANFQWGSLSSQQQNWLNRDPITGVVDNLGADRVDYIRGDDAEEQSQGGPFRNRDSRLGAFLAPDLAYVQAPANGYAGRVGFPEGGEAYAQFRQDHRDRAPMLYIGGNDGMLHAFDAMDGSEVWAFIPHRVSHNLARLTTPQYQFVPFVNNAPVSSDVYFNGAWRTVLIGTLGLGGQGVYAIDITDPASPDILWEFSDQTSGAARLGYTYGQPAITRLSNGNWVALVPGGYNNDGTVDYATRGLPNPRNEATSTVGDGRAALFVVNIQTGALVDTFNLPSAAVGVATPTVGDYEYDFKADFVVAGDLNGNLWRVGLRQDGDAPDYGVIDRVFQGSADRPITSAPRVFPDPVSGEMIMVFGTGKYLELEDREVETSDPRQAIYGVRECRFRSECEDYPITPGDLVQQTLSAVGGDFITMNTTHYLDADAAGWRLSLGNTSNSFLGGALTGERIIDRPLAIFSTGIVVLNSFIPSSEPCAPEGSGVLYILSAFTGGFALPDGLNEDGDEVLPGDPVFEGGASNAVGRFFASRPPTQFFDCPHGGCFVAGGNRFYGKPIIRRSGWREIPTD